MQVYRKYIPNNNNNNKLYFLNILKIVSIKFPESRQISSYIKIKKKQTKATTYQKTPGDESYLENQTKSRSTASEQIQANIGYARASIFEPR